MANKKKTTTPKVKEAEKQSVILSSLPQNIMKIGGHVEEDKNIYIASNIIDKTKTVLSNLISKFDKTP